MRTAQRIQVRGRVQGVGFRPFVCRLAREFGLAGWVRNRGGGVEIHAEGDPAAIERLIDALVSRAPPLADPQPPVHRPAEFRGYAGFEILLSDSGDKTPIHVPPDHFVCPDCLDEMRDPAARRYRYPFINCTQCGPRYTLIDRLPYDRPNTAMADFPLCQDCRREYEDIHDRRYHAQPLACPLCGPVLEFRELSACIAIPGNEPALSGCIEALRQGQVVAVKGVGGYHLLCDARSDAAVGRLRERKRRPDKPLAVLIPWFEGEGVDWLARLAEPRPDERELLASPLRPIVIVQRSVDSDLSGLIAPGLDEIGLMYPYSPLHHLLAGDYGAPLVATSANLSGEPVLTDGAEVERQLAHVADAFLHHDRPIRRPADDSVYRRSAGSMRPLRLGRGTAPLEMPLRYPVAEPTLALGADLKNTIALAFEDRAVVSPHLGNLGAPRSLDVFGQLIRELSALYGIAPKRVVCDAHPDYFSSRWARACGLEIHRVLHHHAHASALYGEFGPDGDILVFAWDGTGFGGDGTLWGGETLLGRPGGWRRVGSLRPFRLIGGEKASAEPWRCALAACWEAGLDWSGCPVDPAPYRHVWERGINSPYTSSAGRLFDAAAALIGVTLNQSHEGQAGMRLEALAGDTADFIELPARRENGLYRIDWSPLLPALMDGSQPAGYRSALLHASLAHAVLAQARAIRGESGVNLAGLTGGVFQNRILAELTANLLRADGFEVVLPASLPVNDAAIAYGQLVETAGAGRAPSPA
ncbi:[NiFe] hydrogenase maturation protein HypF [Methylococcus capsulatus str. Bath]|uniref:Carbamoyltransferase HypF n=1 Tax=Methylococcus capsulatus (strain ATCC 33009 / NCIMB 11132 / Bath) TaxID=243233 RepID=Q607Z3_METCA|nr:carbamoyltransferase HypF [Methylococcus capsulatus]AAU92405.1 [NiFe] hydrogenase maturation protein HypF [Methylococcus capsulatus str. Bath]